MNATKLCSIDGCENKILARELCNAHYKRWRKHGDPLKGLVRRFKTVEENIESRTISKPNGCLEWIGYKDVGGYGVIQIGEIHWRVHRYAWSHEHGAIPDNMEIDHMCHNRACHNIDHLRVVTRKQNTENHQGATSRSSSGVRGVWWDEKVSKWCVLVTHHGERHWGGSHANLHDAESAAINLRNELHTHNDLDRIA